MRKKRMTVQQIERYIDARLYLKKPISLWKMGFSYALWNGENIFEITPKAWESAQQWYELEPAKMVIFKSGTWYEQTITRKR